MELTVEILDPIYCTIVLSLAFLVPFNTDPEGVAGFGVILQLADVPY